MSKRAAVEMLLKAMDTTDSNELRGAAAENAFLKIFEEAFDLLETKFPDFGDKLFIRRTNKQRRENRGVS